MHRAALLFFLWAIALTVGPAVAHAQDLERVGERLLEGVMPEADRFGPADGEPLVKRAYRDDELIGYVFLTSDLPPEEQGYSGPIQTLVGVTTGGEITGVRPTSYRESIRYDLGDFLSEPGFLKQFVGKLVSDRFAVRQDIDGISGVTISVRAMARTVRDAARRVALAYLPPPEASRALTPEEILGLSWYEMQRQGIAVTTSVQQRRRNVIELSVVHLGDEAFGRYLVGTRYDQLVEEVEDAGGADEVFLYVVGSNAFAPQLRTGWALEQGGRTVEIPRERVVTIGRPSGILSGESSQFGALLLGADEVDVASPVTFAFDRGRPDLGVFYLEYTPPPAALVADAAPSVEVRPVDAEPASPAPVRESDADEPTPAIGPAAEPSAAADAASEPEMPAPEPATELISAPDGPVAAASQAVRVDVVDEQVYGEAVPSAPWSRVGLVLLVVLLAGAAFFTKHAALRWVSLAATLVLLGWVDGGFLSISHVTGFIWVGLSAVRSDVALLVLTVVTVATVVLWGRLFCGFLCPFGALQDFIDRAVPRRFKRELPDGLHRAAWKAKYVILVVILGAAALGVQVSLYQYFEPFGTVFFVGTNALLWVIAAAVLTASAVIPRFYCRYLCPLGALLATGSLISLSRIKRVAQCDHCHVCEQRCPTRAIVGPRISFAECVRCNVCEVQLIERTGVCRHDMEEVESRLVQLRSEGVGASR